MKQRKLVSSLSKKYKSNAQLYALLLFLFPSFVWAAPKAGFSVAQPKGCAPLVVDFVDQSDSTVVKWDWDFGNGNKSTLKSPSAIYAHPGLYSIRLIVEDALGRKDTLIRSQMIEVFKSPVADFSSSVSSVCEKTLFPVVHQVKLGSAGIKSFTWDMGNGTTYFKEKIAHAYPFAGVYSITLMVEDSNACVSHIRKDQFVEVFANPKVDIIVDKPLACGIGNVFNFSPVTAASNLSVFSWHFGNGDSSNQQKPAYTYKQLGSYEVSLRVVDNKGCFALVKKPAMVNVLQLKADYSASDTKVCEKTTVSFTNKTSPLRSDISYAWAFGDGSSTVVPNPQKSYANAGLYSVRLIAFIAGTNCRDTFVASKKVEVVKPDPIVPVISDSVFCQLPKRVFFSPSMTTSSAMWSFTGSPYDTSSKPVTSFLYEKQGSFSVAYSFKDLKGCEIKGVINNAVQVRPVPLSIKGELKGCIPFTETFEAVVGAGHDVKSYSWYKDGVKISSKKSVSITFDQAGEGMLTLEVETKAGCHAIVSADYAFGEKTNPDFEPKEKEICFTKVIRFVNKTDTSSRVSVTDKKWIIENKTLGSWDAEHKFTQFQNQKVTLITYNYGCPDTITKEFNLEGSEEILQGPVAQIGLHYDTCARVLKIDNKAESYTSFRWTINGVSDTATQGFVFDLEDSSQVFNIKLWATNANNLCPDDSLTRKVVTVPKLYPSWNMDTLNCSPAVIQFTNTSNAIPTDIYRWYVNGSEVIPSQNDPFEVVSALVNMDYKKGAPGDFNPIFRFGNSGNYKIQLMSDRFNCLDTLEKNIYIKGPEIDVTFEQMSACLPLEIKLIDKLYAPGKKAYWLMGNGDTVHMQAAHMMYTYYNAPENGIFTLRYLEFDADNCLSWRAFELPVTGPSIQIAAVSADFCDKTVIKFNAQVKNVSASAILAYEWSMGDGVSINQKAFDYPYKSDGTYDVTLKVTLNNVCMATVSKKVDYKASQLKAIVSSDTNGAFCPPLLVGFSHQSIRRPNYPITSFHWDFGDGTQSVLEAPQKTYIRPGKFSVRLIVNDALGCSDTAWVPDMIFLKGPLGTFSFDKDMGCEPLPIQFTSKTNSPYNKLIWDLGDGNLHSDTLPKHVYAKPGVYTPMLILEDTMGCRFTLPQQKSITVFAKPKALYTADGFCLGDSTRFLNYSSITHGSIQNLHWNIGQSHKLIHNNPSVLFTERGQYMSSLEVISDKGCRDTLSQPILIRGITPKIQLKEKQYCVGDTLKIENLSTADGQLTYFRWELPNGQQMEGKNLHYVPSKKGYTNWKLYMQDDLGCDTLIPFNNFALIGDTLPSMSPQMLSVSVEDDFTVQIKHARSEEIDFHQYKLYRKSGQGPQLIHKTEDRNTTQIFEKGLNTLSNVYCYTLAEENLCGKQQKPDTLHYHCTIDISGQADTNKAEVKWNAYDGWKEVNRYDLYRMLEGETSYSYIAQLPGNTLQFTDTAIFCRNKHYYRVKAYDKNSSEFSWSDTCIVEPIYVNTVPTPRFEVSSIFQNQSVELLWKEPKDSRNKILYYEIERSDKNNLHFRHLQTIETNTTIGLIETKDEKNTQVQQNNYYYKLRAIDQCHDKSEWSEETRPILLTAVMNKEYKPELKWTDYLSWQEGIAYYQIEQRLADGAFHPVGRTKDGKQTQFIHHEVQYTCLDKYEYRVIAIKNTNTNQPNELTQPDRTHYSISNYAEVEVESKLYAPNAFSPNNDGLNDTYQAKGIFIKSFTLQIYNRWGEKLYETTDCMAEWDGYYEGSVVQDGVYVVKIKAIGVDNKLHTFDSDLTIIK